MVVTRRNEGEGERRELKRRYSRTYKFKNSSWLLELASSDMFIFFHAVASLTVDFDSCSWSSFFMVSIAQSKRQWRYRGAQSERGPLRPASISIWRAVEGGDWWS